MLKNYLVVALRALKRQRGYTALNVIGLSAGLACAVLILLFAQHELSYDQFHNHADRTYRVYQERPGAAGSDVWQTTSPAVASTLASSSPQVEAVTTVGAVYKPVLSVGDRYFTDAGLYADASFFDVLTFPLLDGDPATALAEPGGLVLTESFARKVFGDADPMGQTLSFRGERTHTVTGLMADVPDASHAQFEYVLPILADPFYVEGLGNPPWRNNGWFTYAVLGEVASPARVEDQMGTVINRALAEAGADDQTTFRLHPLTDIHLRPAGGGGALAQVHLFLGIGVLVLLLACVNYTNLAVAQSFSRRREVGVRRAIGAQRGQLVTQFLGESLVTAAIAGVVAVGLAYAVRPVFEDLVGEEIALDPTNPLFLFGLLGLVVVVGLAAGLYPALVAAAQRPSQALRGSHAPASQGRLQKGLIVFQYAVSVALVAGGLTVLNQVRFMQEADLGYDREHVLVVEVDDEAVGQRFDALRADLARDPSVLAVAYSRHLPTYVGSQQEASGWEGSQGQTLPTLTTSISGDFLETHGVDVIAGRGFAGAASDTLGTPVALLTESAASAMGWAPEEAIGQPFDFTDDAGRRTIVGVVRDIHAGSIQNPLAPLILTPERHPTGFLSAKVRPGDLPATLAHVKRVVSRYSVFPADVQFMDDEFDQLYQDEAQLGKVIGFFTALALVIAALGLFGLAAHAATRRRKEVGVRKVLGASVGRLVALLTRDMVVLVGVAFLVGAPVAYVAAGWWLDGFVYRADPGPAVFLAAGGLALGVALLAVSYHTIRAATADPVRALRAH